MTVCRCGRQTYSGPDFVARCSKCNRPVNMCRCTPLQYFDYPPQQRKKRLFEGRPWLR